MKPGLPILLFMALCLLVNTKGTTQGITLTVKHIPLAKVFAQVEAQTDVKFFYRTELLKKAEKVSLQLQNASLKEVLDRCFESQPLSYEIIDKIVVVKEKPESSSSHPSSGAERTSNGLTTVNGRIITEGGEAVDGATVTIKGTSKATSSNQNGDFSLSVRDLNTSLVITSVGIEPQEVPLKGGTQLTIVVTPKINTLDQVQIIGYGQTTRRFNTGNVTTIKTDEIEQQPVGHILAALQGRVPGLDIVQLTGVAGGGFRALIRGYGSIAAGNNPLFIVDGVPYPDGLFGLNNSYKNGVNGLTLLNLNEIERVEVLKDADATAIYGSRGANGVILILTKKGKPGKASIDMDLYSGWGKVTSRPKLLNLPQYLQMRHESIRNDSAQITSFDYDINGSWDTTRYTDWSKELLGGTAAITDAKLSFTGGTPTLNYSIDGGYHRETTVMPLEGSYRRYGAHVHLATGPESRKYRIEISGSYEAGVDDLPPIDFAHLVQYFKPNQPPAILPDGSINYNAVGWFNPYFFYPSRYKMNQDNLISDLRASWSPVKGLELRASLGYNLQGLHDFSGSPAIPFSNSVSSANFATNQNHTLIIEPQAFYSLKWKHQNQFSALVGATWQQSASAYQNMRATGFSNDALLSNPAAASLLTIPFFRYTNYKYLGVFSRLSYNYSNKYLLNLTGRVDGITRFGPDKQFHPFGAIGAAWILSEEGFMRHLAWLHFAKLRGSYGLIGNSQISDYAFVETYAPYLQSYQGIIGLTPNQLFDRNLGWELKKSLEIALELQLFKGRLGLAVSAYQNRNSEELLRTNLSTVTGFFTVTTNRPVDLQNRGLEVVLSANPVSLHHFAWNLNANASFQKSKLLHFEDLERSDYRANLLIGYPMPIIKAYKFGGVDPQTGTYFFIDHNGRPTAIPTEEDKTEVINILPRSFGGITNSFSYKSWSLDVTCSYMVRQGIDVERRELQYVEGLARWQKPGDRTSIAKYSNKLSSTSAMNKVIQSTGGYSDASYVRVQNIALSYRFGQKVLERVHVKNLRLYLLGQNLFTFTHVKQYDPENIEQLSMAPLRVLTVGFQITFQ